MRPLFSSGTLPVISASGLSLGSDFRPWREIRKAATGPPMREPMMLPMVPAATPTVVAESGAPNLSIKMEPKAEAVPTPPDMAEEEHCRASRGCRPMTLPTRTPSTSCRVIRRQAATAILMHSLPPARRSSL